MRPLANLGILILTWVITNPAAQAFAVDSNAIGSPSTQNASETWIRVPVVVRPVERVMVRGYKGSTSTSYINHSAANRILRVRAGRSNELYFGTWKFNVDVSEMNRFGHIELSVKVAQIDQSAPDTYFELGQQTFSGKVLRDGASLRLIAGEKLRFENAESNVIADLEFGNIDEASLRALSARQHVMDPSDKPTTAY
jgi:hypothetical protein